MIHFIVICNVKRNKLFSLLTFSRYTDELEFKRYIAYCLIIQSRNKINHKISCNIHNQWNSVCRRGYAINRNTKNIKFYNLTLNRSSIFTTVHISDYNVYDGRSKVTFKYTNIKEKPMGKEDISPIIPPFVRHYSH